MPTPPRAPRSSTSPAGSCSPASRTPTCTRSRAASSGCAATCPSCRRRRSTSRRSGRTSPRTPDRALGRSAAAGRCRRSDPPGRWPRTWTRSSATGRSSCPTATTTAPGSTPRRCGSPGIDRRHPGPAGRPDRARRRRASPPARCTRGRWRWSSGTSRRPPTRSTTPGCSSPRSYLHSLGVTAWQDAILGVYAGNGDPGVGVPAGRARPAR